MLLLTRAVTFGVRVRRPPPLLSGLAAASHSLRTTDPLTSATCLVSRRSLNSSSRLWDKKDQTTPPPPPKVEEKVGVVKRFKQMWKDYWYVLIPVHVVTSLGWFGGFYFLCKSGVDVPGILAHLGASEAYLEKVRHSNMGYYALAYACYKIATPARYTVTIGGTTLSIRYLTNLGYLRTTEDLRSDIIGKQRELKDKRDQMVEELREKRAQIKDEWTTAWQNFAKQRRKK